MNKKIGIMFCLLVFMFLLILAPVFLTNVSATFNSHAPPQYDEIHVLIDGSPLHFDVPPQKIDGVTMVPMRPVFEALGVDVQWYDSSKQILATTETGDTILITLDSNIKYFNNFPRYFDVPAQIINGHVFVPLRVVAQAVDSEIIWAPAANAVIINTSEHSLMVFSMRASSSIALPNRKLTELEMAQWLHELDTIGGFHVQELEVIRLLNQRREDAGLGQLSISPALSNAARFKSQSMSDLDYYSHVGVYGSATELAEVFGFDGAVGENLYRGPTSPKWAFLGWMLSPGHRDLMLRPSFDTVGVGLYVGECGQFYWTMLLSGDEYS